MLWVVAIYLAVQYLFVGTPQNGENSKKTNDPEFARKRNSLNTSLREALIALGFKPENRDVSERRKPQSDDDGEWEALIWLVNVKPDFDLQYARSMLTQAVGEAGATPEANMDDPDFPLIVNAFVKKRLSHRIRFALPPSEECPPMTNAGKFLGPRDERLAGRRFKLDTDLRDILAGMELNGPPLLIREFWDRGEATNIDSPNFEDIANWVVSVSKNIDFDWIFNNLDRNLPNAGLSREPVQSRNGIKAFRVQVSYENKLSHNINFTTYHDCRGKSLKKQSNKNLVFLAPPRIAIIIDDIGFDENVARDLMQIGLRITISILPYTKNAEVIAERAKRRCVEVMLHLPMEPDTYPDDDPGKYALFTSQTTEEIENLMEKNISLVPHIRGVNNHMGSKAMADSRVVNTVLSAVQKHKLYFIDSRTTTSSLGYDEALRIGIPAAKKTIFIDDGEKGKSYCIDRLMELIEHARTHGTAVGIGHPHQGTIEALKETANKFREEGVEVVFASEIVS